MAPSFFGPNWTAIFVRFFCPSFPRETWIHYEDKTKSRSFSWRLQRHARILIYRMWPIDAIWASMVSGCYMALMEKKTTEFLSQNDFLINNCTSCRIIQRVTRLRFLISSSPLVSSSESYYTRSSYFSLSSLEFTAVYYSFEAYWNCLVYISSEVVCVACLVYFPAELNRNCLRVSFNISREAKI